jgi:RNA polymerase sigma-70 factor (ECF subfamily)
MKMVSNVLELARYFAAIQHESIADGVSKRQAKDELTDGDLLRLSGQGDEEAFLVLYRRHQGPIFRFALHMSGRTETAEEVTQEVFLALLSELQRYTAERGSLQGYLIGVARNKVRRQLRESRVFAPATEEGSYSGIALFEGLSKEQETAALRAAILRLPPNYREVIVLCDIEDMDYTQAARQLGCAVGTVRSRLHRARAILGAKLGKREACGV